MNSNMIDSNSYNNTLAQEAFSVLNTNWALNNTNQKPKVISINSFMPAEGKTTVAINLAIAAARSGANTLLLDADLRKPSHLKIKEEPAMGLADYYQEMDFNEIISPTSINKLKYVGPGIKPVDPVEFLSGDIYGKFLDKVSVQYDMIIIDSPPSGKYIDGAIIAAKASGALIVTNADKTSYKNIERMKWHMEHVAANIIGVVMNRVARSDYKSYFVLK